MSASADRQVLRGNCHCGAYKYSVSLLSPITHAVHHCNCSHCEKLGANWLEYKPEDFMVLSGKGALQQYTFGEKKNKYHFCPTCGSTVLYNKLDEQIEKFNVQTLYDFDLDSLAIKTHDCAANPPLYDRPKYAGPEMSPSEGEKVYTGGCHCGNVTLAFRTKPLPEVEGIKQCDCSICTHNGYVFAYPNKKDVAEHVAEPAQLTSYQCGKKYSLQQFCGICAVPVLFRVIGPPPEIVARMSEKMKAYRDAMVQVQPVNLHVLDGVEWEQLKVKKEKGGKEDEPKYVVNWD